MRQCEYKKYLSNYLDNQLNPLQESQVEQHLPLCNSCKEEWEELNKLKKLCAILPEEELPNGLRQRILNQIEFAKKPKRKYTWIQRVAVPLVAALFIFIAVKYGLGDLGLSKSAAPQQEGALQEPVVMATHEADDSIALTSGGASKGDGITMDNVTDEKARQKNEIPPDSSVKPDSEANEEGSENFISGLEASEENSKNPTYKSIKYGLSFTGVMLIAIFLIHIVKRKR